MWSNILKWLDENILAIVFDCQEESFFWFFFVLVKLFGPSPQPRVLTRYHFFGILNFTNPDKDL